MRRLAVAFALILGLLGLAGAGFAEDAKKTPPPLPDYSKAPYKKFGEKKLTARAHPEWGELSCEAYATSETRAPGESAITVCKNAEGKLTVALWILAGENSLTYREYQYKDSAWVFQDEARGE